MMYDTSNELFDLATRLISQTSRNVFLTGKAGTGKTTFLRHIRNHCAKQMVVVAPTGVAAINANGVTIHSLFQLPLCPFIPVSKLSLSGGEDFTTPHDLIRRLRINSEKKKIFQELELLIIDEISMVRCDVLDAIDLVLRHMRQRHGQRFGGVQVLFIGDMYQLSPVVRDNEWRVLSDHYKSPYFFDSQVMNGAEMAFIEFTKVYRQKDQLFIDVLNQVRDNQMDEAGATVLNSRYQPEFKREEHRDYIFLTTHNEKARNINFSELRKLEGRQFEYSANVEGDFVVNSAPADSSLQLKVGAQVMFIKNDSDRDKRYYNGKIGIVTELREEEIKVLCRGDAAPIDVKREFWENIRYTLNDATRRLEEQVLGSFTQFPLRLAWAITIHKSQGLTFEKAIIDVGEAFAPGQVYVALSRCTNLEGMVLHSRFRRTNILTDERIIQFSRNCHSKEQLQTDFVEASNEYKRETLLSIFDFERALTGAREILDCVTQDKSGFKKESITWSEHVVGKLNSLQSTSRKFGELVTNLLVNAKDNGNKSRLEERLSDAMVYFSKELLQLLEILRSCPARTGSRPHAREFNDTAHEIFTQLSFKAHLLKGLTDTAAIDTINEIKKGFVAPAFVFNPLVSESGVKTKSPHPELYLSLKKLRDVFSSRKNVAGYFVVNSTTLDEMARYLPQSLEELSQISGFGEAKLSAYGNEFLELVVAYSQEHGLSSNMAEKPIKKKKKESAKSKPDTKGESLRLYKSGKSLSEIAVERNLAISTVEGHLSHYVRIGELQVDQFVAANTITLISEYVKNTGALSTSLVKEGLGDAVTYGEIKFVLASEEFKRELSTHVDH